MAYTITALPDRPTSHKPNADTPTRVRPELSKQLPSFPTPSTAIEATTRPLCFRRPAVRNSTHAVTPTDHAPQGRVSVESMTLKEAYSVPKHTSAICVQSFDDSLNSAIHITYRISLRSSSLREPRYPLLRVLDRFVSALMILATS